MKEKRDCSGIPIEALDIQVRYYNCFRRDNILTCDSIIATLKKGRQAMRDFRPSYGETGWQEILAGLESLSCLPDDLLLNVDVRTQEKRMRWVISSQLDNGSWFDDIEMTIAAILSVIRSHEYQEYVDIETGIEWLKQHEHEIDDAVIFYAFERVMAERYSKAIPDYPFPQSLTFTTIPFYKERGARNLDELRYVALLKGEAVKINPSPSASVVMGLGATYTPLEIIWMSVGAPRD